MIKPIIWIAVVFTTACALLIGTAELAQGANTGQVCVGLTSGKIDVNGSVKTITITASPGNVITQYCVKAGSVQQGNGPVYVNVDPPQTSVTISHPSGKDISHYSWTEQPAPPPTTEPPPTTTEPPPVTTLPPPPVTTLPPPPSTTTPPVTTSPPPVTTQPPVTTTPETTVATTVPPTTVPPSTVPSSTEPPSSSTSVPPSTPQPDDTPSTTVAAPVTELPATGTTSTIVGIIVGLLCLALGVAFLIFARRSATS